jgi:glycosyltransferase involved in cell wall biosynthesis
MFFFPAIADCHKNFEDLCAAAEILEKKLGADAFKVVLTIDGSENKYAAWLRRKWGHIASIDFHGYMSKEDLYDHYGKAACLVFPSRVETWGLPISEFKPSGKPMILADLPYARESAAGAEKVFFFEISDIEGLARQMELVISGKNSNFVRISPSTPEAPFAPDWETVFELLLSDESTSTR